MTRSTYISAPWRATSEWGCVVLSINHSEDLGLSGSIENVDWTS